MSAPTHEDAQILIQMSRWFAEARLDKALRFVWSEDYIEDFDEFNKKYPRGTKHASLVGSLCGWYETLAAFWINGLINEKLLNDWILVTPLWERVSGFTLGVRKFNDDPSYYEHFESLAKAQALK